MTTLLEQRYRRALILLPAPYREVWADDMVATFVDAAYAAAPDDPEGVDVGRPRLGELLSIAGLAVRLRVGGADAPARPRLWGDAVRLAALIGLLALASLSLAFLLVTAWVALRLPGSDLPPGVASIPARGQVLTGVLELAWVPAFILVLCGQSRSALPLAGIALATDLVVVAVDLARTGRVAWAGWAVLAVSAATVAALAAYRPASPARPPGRWLLALGAGVVAVVAVSVLSAGAGWLYLDLPGLSCVTFTVTVLGRRRSPDAAWPLALALVAVAVLLVQLAILADRLDVAPPGSASNTVGAVEVAAVLGLGLDCAVRARRHWRQLPPVTADTIAGHNPVGNRVSEGGQ